MRDNEYTQITGQMRGLLRDVRTAGGLTQTAAAKAARIHPNWWSRIESGNVTQTKTATLARMFYVIDTEPDVLRARGLGDLADRVAVLRGLRRPPDPDSDLIATATPQERAILATVLRTMRDVSDSKKAVNAERAAG